MPSHYPGTDAERLALTTYITLLRAAESVAIRSTAHLSAFGLTESQFGILETLLHLGSLRVSDLARKHLKSRNNFTTVVDNLERDGLVRRERIAEDRRVVMVHLTDAGRSLIERIFPAHVAAVVREMSVLTPEEQRLFGDLCRRLGKQEQK